MNDALRRAIRTAIQAFTGVILAQVTLITIDIAGGYVPDINWIKRVGASAAVAAAISLVTWLHNYAEDNSSFPAILKANASVGQNPVTSDPVK